MVALKQIFFEKSFLNHSNQDFKKQIKISIELYH